MTQTTSIHAEAGLHRKLVLFASQLEIYLAHFPNCHKFALTQQIRLAFIDVFNLVTEAQNVWAKARSIRPHVISSFRRDARRKIHSWCNIKAWAR